MISFLQRFLRGGVKIFGLMQGFFFLAADVDLVMVILLTLYGIRMVKYRRRDFGQRVELPGTGKYAVNSA